MRIELNPGAPALASREGHVSENRPGETQVSEDQVSEGRVSEDQAQLSVVHGQIQALAAQASQFPEVRQETVNTLRQMLLGSAYQPSSWQVAEALLAHMLVKPAA
jgi:hypothetical protein